MADRTVRGLVAGLSVLASAGLGLADPPASGKYWVYLGTGTGGKSTSKGIYRSELDLATGKLSAPELVAELSGPTFLSLSPDGSNLYSVGEIAGDGGKKQGGVAAYRVDPATGGLTKINQKSSGGAGPCHVSVHPGGGMVLAANYGGGSWALYYARKDGSLSDPVVSTQLEGSGPNPQRQKEPHAHCGVFFGDVENGFAVVDLGSDLVWTYKFDPSAAKATPSTPFKLPPGSGPRHIAINSEGRIAYVNGELDSTVNVVRFDPTTGVSEVLQTLSTLPGGKPVAGNSTAEVRIHPNDKFVYVSNRGHDSVAVFKVDPQTGKLTEAGHATSPDVKTPRNFNLDPTGQWLLVASQAGENVAVFKVDPETGMPTATGEKVTVSTPMCVKFLPKP